MKPKAKIFLIIFILLAVVLSASSEEQGERHFDWWAFLGSILNSTILFGGLIFVLRKPLIKLLTQRSLDIKNDIIERERHIRITSGEFQKINERLKQIEDEVKEMQRIARLQGEEEKNRIEELGRQESRRIINLSETEIKNRVESSLNQLKAKIARLTIDHFKKDIEDQLDEPKHRKVIDRNIDAVAENIERERQVKSGKR